MRERRIRKWNNWYGTKRKKKTKNNANEKIHKLIKSY